MEIRFNENMNAILQSANVSDFVRRFDMMQGPHIYNFLTEEDCQEIYRISKSLKLSSKAPVKRKMIEDIMANRGFKKLGAGTNRIIFKHTEDNFFVAKVSTDVVSLQDNIGEYYNQALLKPFVAKTFCVHPTGCVAFQERVRPILRAKEFELIADDIFDIIVHNFIGKFVLEDIGTEFFMNWGIRNGFGPVLLDYPYCYELDGNKLFCNSQDPITGEICDGILDYTVGFNAIRCPKCNKRYPAKELRNDIKQNKIVLVKGGDVPMKVCVKKGDKIIASAGYNTDTILPRSKFRRRKPAVRKSDIGIKIRVSIPGKEDVVSVNGELENTSSKHTEKYESKRKDTTSKARFDPDFFTNNNIDADEDTDKEED